MIHAHLGKLWNKSWANIWGASQDLTGFTGRNRRSGRWKLVHFLAEFPSIRAVSPYVFDPCEIHEWVGRVGFSRFENGKDERACRD
jgi:hypothetical protein